MTYDFKQAYKDLYQPKTTPSIIDVPKMIFIAIEGRGDPNTSKEYASAVETLYGLSYAIKMSNKETLEYVVPPLEGLWNVDDDFWGSGASIADKSKFTWTMLIRQPEFVTDNIYDSAQAKLAKKKPAIDTSKAKLITLTEGLCVQVLHIGSYDEEPATIVSLERFATENGYVIDINENRLHHEIYLSDPRKVVSQKLKTILRHPIRRA